MRTLSLFGVLAMTVPILAADFPDPLAMKDGTKVTTKADWEAKRKPELKRLFQQEMYGQFPGKTPEFSATVVHEAKAFDGKGVIQEVELTFKTPRKSPPLYLLVARPAAPPKGGAPVFVGLNFSGNHTLVDDDKIHITPNWCYDKQPGVEKNRATAAGRGQAKGVWPLADIVAAGYAVVTCYCGDLEEDRPNAGVPLKYALFPPPPGILPPDAMATIMFWAWGLTRMADYVETDPSFNPKRMAVIGHSRLGKTALLAGAFDDRFACVFPHQAGCGGTGPSRHDDPKAEGVKRINAAFPHWFCTNFKKYNDDPAALPFDQHCLLALCAPRPVLYTNATEDLWANPSGQFDMMRRATPVYELLGVKGIEAEKTPDTGKLVDSRLGYWIRDGKHEMNRDDWKTFLAFADEWMK
jgi:hypothetical protein